MFLLLLLLLIDERERQAKHSKIKRAGSSNVNEVNVVGGGLGCPDDRAWLLKCGASGPGLHRDQLWQDRRISWKSAVILLFGMLELLWLSAGARPETHTHTHNLFRLFLKPLPYLFVAVRLPATFIWRPFHTNRTAEHRSFVPICFFSRSLSGVHHPLEIHHHYYYYYYYSSNIVIRTCFPKNTCSLSTLDSEHFRLKFDDHIQILLVYFNQMHRNS